MSTIRGQLVDKIKEFREVNNYNTYQLRKLEREGKTKPVAGINVTTINRIQNEPDYIPSIKTLSKLLDFFSIKYERTFTGLKIVDNEG